MTVPKLPSTLFSFLIFFIKKQKKSFFAIPLLALFWSLDTTLFPYVLKMVVDVFAEYDTNRSVVFGALGTPLIFGLSLLIGVELAMRLQGLITAYTYPELEARIRMAMFDYTQRHSYKFFSTQFAGSLSNKISDMAKGVTTILELSFKLFFPVAIALIIALLLFAQVSPLFSVILFIWVLALFVAIFPLALKCNVIAEQHAVARSDLAGKVVDSFTNSANVKLFSRYRFESHYLAQSQQKEKKRHIETLLQFEKMKLLISLICFLGAGVGINWYILVSWQKGAISTGDVVFIFNATWNITMMVWFAATDIPALFKEWGSCQQALELISAPHDIEDAKGAGPLEVKKGEIIFDGVSFRYTKDQELFQDKHLVFKAGEKVGLVGFSGSGKTTLVHLILRYFDVEEGRLLIDGQDISSVTQESLRANISFIPQDTALFHRTIRENIRYGKPEASDEEIMAAAKRAHAHEFIEKMPLGYDSLVGERGVMLSGGQRQRIAIARAFLKDAPIIILDEATSALDSLTEKLIQESLKGLMKGRTTLVIAHRLSTLADMDRILVFKEGHITEEGSHNELLKMGGHYATLWQMQAGGFLLEEESS